MSRIKLLMVVEAVALAVLAVPGPASATVLTSGGSTLLTGTTLESTGTSSVLKAGFATVTCTHNEMDSKTSNTGGTSETVEASVTDLAFKECNATVSTLKKGKLIFHHASGSNGTVTSEGTEVTVSTAGTSCVYGTPTATSIGTLTGGSPAKLDAEASLVKVSGGFLCASPASWTASYTITTPSSLSVAASGGESGADLNIEPETFRFPSIGTMEFTIKNVSGSSRTINFITAQITSGANGSFTWSDPNGCEGKTLSPNATCVIKVNCYAMQAHGYIQAFTASNSDKAYVNSTA